MQFFSNRSTSNKRRSAPDRSRGAVAIAPPKSLAQSASNRATVRKGARSQPAFSSAAIPAPRDRLLKYFAIAGLAMLLQSASLPIGAPVAMQKLAKATSAAMPPPVPLTYSMDKLRGSLTALADVPKLRTGAFVLDPRDGRYLDLDGRKAYAAASMIKLPVLVSLLAAIDRGDIKFADQLRIRQDLITGGSGSLQWRPVDSLISVRDTAELMMVVSDNTATNMIIDALGGKQRLNDEFASWGLAQTRINNMLGDFEGTNKTSPYDLVYLLTRVDRGEIVSSASRNWLFDVMRHTRIRTLLNPGLGPGATIAHKTGDIGTMVGDVGVVFAPNGSRYIVSIQVERPFNDRRGNALIRTMSRGIYNSFVTDTAAHGGTLIGSLPEPATSTAVLASVPGVTAGSFHAHHRRHHHHR